MENIIAIMIFSVPIIWIVMHYTTKGRNSVGLSAEESKQLDELLQVADTMAERIKTLESILDADYPDWREHHGKV
jgi:phage shock protein B